MENFLSGVTKKAEEYAGNQGEGQAAAGGAPAEAQGTDWSSLAKLAGHFGDAQQEHGDGLDISTFTSFLGKKTEGSASDPQQAAQQAGADPSVINKLLSFYHKQTGNTFESGGGGSFDQLQSMAAKQLGIDIPLPILKKMVSWKLNGLL